MLSGLTSAFGLKCSLGHRKVFFRHKKNPLGSGKCAVEPEKDPLAPVKAPKAPPGCPLLNMPDMGTSAIKGVGTALCSGMSAPTPVQGRTCHQGVELQRRAGNVPGMGLLKPDTGLFMLGIGVSMPDVNTCA